jgi:hypothetical protein
MEKCRNVCKNTNESYYFSQKNRQKMLDKGLAVWYISQARLRGTGKRARRTLKTIQNEERAIKEEDSEDSKRV